MVLACVVAGAAAPLLELDRWRLGILFVYPPRIAIAAVALALALAWPRRAARVVLVAAASLAAFELEWGGCTFGACAGGRTCGLVLVSFNTHNDAAALDGLRGLADRVGADFLSLHEVRLGRRRELQARFPEFRFLAMTPPPAPASTGVYSSVVGVRKELLGQDAAVVLEPSITGYRTFAVRLSLGGAPLWLVAVHSTKPLWLENGMLVAVWRAPWSSGWHREEAELLAAWVRGHLDGSAIVASGDFNAPAVARATRLPGLRHAHAAGGRGPALSWPRWLPLWDIDHTLVSANVRICRSRFV
ncbi:MAG: hypothetical protein D6815_02495, partial [Candidatus Dadabacteria bacterium]